MKNILLSTFFMMINFSIYAQSIDSSYCFNGSIQTTYPLTEHQYSLYPYTKKYNIFIEAECKNDSIYGEVIIKYTKLRSKKGIYQKGYLMKTYPIDYGDDTIKWTSLGHYLYDKIKSDYYWTTHVYRPNGKLSYESRSSITDSVTTYSQRFYDRRGNLTYESSECKNYYISRFMANCNIQIWYRPNSKRQRAEIIEKDESNSGRITRRISESFYQNGKIRLRETLTLIDVEGTQAYQKTMIEGYNRRGKRGVFIY